MNFIFKLYIRVPKKTINYSGYVKRKIKSKLRFYQQIATNYVKVLLNKYNRQNALRVEQLRDIEGSRLEIVEIQGKYLFFIFNP